MDADNTTVGFAQWPMAAVALGVVVVAQLTIGTFGGGEGAWRIDRPYDQDHWYYAGLARAVVSHFPPRNPAFTGAPLTQHSFHLAPVGVLAPVMSPYAAMRLLNLLYAVALLLLLRRYFPDRFGAIGFCVFATAPVWGGVNPVSVDLLTRGFHHTPFFLALLPALLERRRVWIGALCAFLLPWLHVLMTVAFAPALAFACWRDRRWAVLGAFIVGGVLSLAAIMVGSRGSADTMLFESLGFRPLEPLLHLIPLAVALVFARDRLIWIMAASAFALTCLVGWQRFYFVFALDVALALAVSEAIVSSSIKARRVAIVCVALAFVFGARWMVARFHDDAPFLRAPVAGAIEWIDANTDKDAVILQAPTPRQVLEDPIAYCELGFGYWVLAERDLFVGAFSWAEDIGLPGDARSNFVDSVFRGEKPPPVEADYLLYGPMEQAMYPGSPLLTTGRLVYADKWAGVYALRARQ